MQTAVTVQTPISTILLSKAALSVNLGSSLLFGF